MTDEIALDDGEPDWANLDQLVADAYKRRDERALAEFERARRRGWIDWDGRGHHDGIQSYT